MGRLRRCAVPLLLVVAAACGGDGGSGPDRVLSAAGAGSQEAAETVPPTTTSTTVAPTTVAPTTTTKPASVVTSTTVRRTTATRPPATATPPIAGYSPAPPPPGVAPDGYGGYGGVTTTSAAGTSLTLSVYPREQYLGEDFQVGATGNGADMVKSFTIDYGDGQVVRSPELASWACASDPRTFGDGRHKVYAAPGTYRITVTVTMASCVWLTIPAGTIGGDLKPIPSEKTFLAESGTTYTVSASMDVLQRPDRPPIPVGPAPGP